MAKTMADLTAEQLRTMVAARDDLLADIAIDLEQAQAENGRLKRELGAMQNRAEQAEAFNERLKKDVEASQDGGARLWQELQAMQERAERAEGQAKRLEDTLRYTLDCRLKGEVPGRGVLETALAEGGA
jgi:chromosome segregation ATPase